MSREEEIIHAAKQRLYRLMKNDLVFELPIFVKENSKYVAYTNNTGIYLSKTLVKTDPFNLETYIAHEIFHDVVFDVSIQLKFKSNILNIAEDYKINYLLKKLYGLDVLKVKYKGLYDKKYDNLSIKEIAQGLKMKQSMFHYSSCLKHPAIRLLANSLQKKYKLNYVEPIVKNSNMAFFDAIKNEYSKFSFENLPFVNIPVASEGLFTRFYSVPEWNYPTFGERLNQTQTVAISPKIQASSYEDKEFSMFSSLYVLKSLNNADNILSSFIERKRNRLSALVLKNKVLKKKIKNAIPGELRKAKLEYKLNKNKILNLRKIIKFFSHKKSLKTLLMEVTSVDYKKRKQSLSSSIEHSTLEPKIDSRNELVQMIRLIQKLSYHKIEEAFEIYSTFKEEFDSFLDENEEELEDFEDSIYEDDEDDEEGEGAGAGEGEWDSEKEKEKIKKQKNISPSKGVGKQHGINSKKLEMFNLFVSNIKLFQNILYHASDFGEKLLSHPTSNVSEDGILNKTITHGSDISKVLGSEFCKLKNKLSKLQFLANLADGGLLQYSDLDNRRTPIVLLLDCSGSMAGKTYEIAAGFCLSLIRALTVSSRGCALIKFSERVDNAFVFTKKVSFLSIVKSLLHPSYGGTDFTKTLSKALDICKEQNWNKAQILFITDGHDTIKKEVLNKVPSSIKLTAVLIGNCSNIEGIQDTVKATRGKLGIELLKVGNKIL